MNQAAVDHSEMTREECAVFAAVGRCWGKENAISQNELAGKVNKTARMVRKIVESLIVKHKIMICSSYDAKNGGYYIPISDHEIEETCKKLHGHAVRILMRESTLKKMTLAELIKQYQMEFPWSGAASAVDCS